MHIHIFFFPCSTNKYNETNSKAEYLRCNKISVHLYKAINLCIVSSEDHSRSFLQIAFPKYAYLSSLEVSSWKAVSCILNNKISHLWWNPKFHKRVNRILPQVTILSQPIPSCTFHTYFLKVVVLLSSHLRPIFQSSNFLQASQSKFAHLTSPTRATWSSNLILLAWFQASSAMLLRLHSSNGNYVPTFQDILSVPTSRTKKSLPSWPLKRGR